MKLVRPAIAILTTVILHSSLMMPGRSQQPIPTEITQAQKAEAARNRLQQAQMGKDQSAINMALYNLAWQLDAKTDDGGDREESIKLYKQLLLAYPEAKYPAQTADILRDLADCYNNQAAAISDQRKDERQVPLQNAIANYRAAGRLYQQLKNDVETAKIFNSLGGTYQTLGDHRSAIAAYHTSYSTLKKIKFPFWEAWILSKIGDCYRALDDVAGNETDQALAFYQQALTLWQTNAPVITPVPTYKGLNPNFRKNSFEASWKTSSTAGTAIRFDIRMGDALNSEIVGDSLLWQTLTMFNLAQTYQEIGDTPQALVFHQEIQRIFPEAIARSPALAKLDAQSRSDAPALLQGLMSLPLSQIYYSLGSDHDAQRYGLLGDQGLSQTLKTVSKLVMKQSNSKQDNKLINLAPLLIGILQNAVAGATSTIPRAEIGDAANTQIADRIYDDIMKQEPEFKKLWENISQQMLKNPQSAQYQPIFDGILSVGLELKGDQLAKKNQGEAALAAYIEAVRLRTNGQLANPQLSQKFSDILKQNISPTDPNKAQFDQLQQKIAPAFSKLTSPAKLYNSIGKVLLKLDRLSVAIESHNQAAQLAEKTDSPEIIADAYFLIGQVYRKQNQAQQAIAQYEKAIPFWKKADNALREAETHLEIATTHRNLGNLPQAQAAVETAIDRIESEKAQNKNNTTDKDAPQPISNYKAYLNLATYLASKQNYYDFYIDLLMERHQKAPTTGYDIQAFQASERSHAKSLRAMLSRAQTLASKPLDTTSAIAIAQVPTLPEIQNRLLDDNSLLLEYALGETRSYVWVVSKQSIKSYLLPPRSQLEPKVQKLILQITDNTTNFHRDPTAQANAQALSAILLAPFKEQLGQKRLLIVADEALQYLPFAALPDPNTSAPLLINHEILGLPAAATTLAFQSRNSKISSKTAPSKTLLMFSDPVFDSTDDRLTKPSALATIKEIDGIYTRLPGTQKEAEAIGKLVPQDQGSFKHGFAANYGAATSESLSQYRFLHFATHGILNSQYPERSGMVMSLLNEQGDLQRSLLSTANTFNLNLSADLVVLSGCNTSLGKQVKGEGLVGLTSGLMYAGSKQVVSSLWPVNDRVTADLMAAFYTGMLQEKLSPAVALRRAQLKILQAPATASPYYWAAFGIQGV
jgi:CHAT domain-containing protein